MKAKIKQIKPKDRLILFNFYDDTGKNVGSRGYRLDEASWEKIPSSIRQILSFIEIKNSPSTALEKLSKKVYEEWIKAREEEKEAGKVELE